MVNQWVNYDKDPFLGPVGKDGKIVRTPFANVATGDGENANNALAAKSFNYHFGWWKKALAENKGKCMFCHDTARNADHKSRYCPILKQLGLKLEKRVESDNTDAALRVTAPPTADPAKSALAPAPSLDTNLGSGTLPGGFLVAAEPASYDLGNKYDYEGKSSGFMYLGTPANSKSSRAYLSLLPSCCHASSKASLLNKIPVQEIGGDILPDDPSTHNRGSINTPPDLSASRSSRDPQGVKTIYLPKMVLALLQNPCTQDQAQTRGGPYTTLLVADTGGTDHMFPDKSAFISYYPIKERRVCMGNISFALILGYRTAIISLNGKKILVRDGLHVPDLRNPLYISKPISASMVWVHWDVRTWPPCLLPHVYT